MFEYGDTIQLIVALLMLHLPLSSALSPSLSATMMDHSALLYAQYKNKKCSYVYAKGRRRERLQVYHVSINLLLPGSTLTVLCTYRQKKRIMSLRRKMSLTWPAQHKFLIAQEYLEKS